MKVAVFIILFARSRFPIDRSIELSNEFIIELRTIKSGVRARNTFSERSEESVFLEYTGMLLESAALGVPDTRYKDGPTSQRIGI